MEEKQDYTNSGFDDLFNKETETDTGIQTEEQFSSKFPQVSGDSIATPIPSGKTIDGTMESVYLTGITQATTGSIANGSGVRATTYISDAINKSLIFFGLCEFTVYQDSVAAANIVPYGSDAIAAGNKLTAWYDLYSNQTINVGTYPNQAPNKSASFTIHVQNATGAPHAYVFRLRWRYLGKRNFS